MTPASSSNADIIVVGTGIAGLAAALALARQGVRVGLLGPRAPLPAPEAGRFDPRVYALSPASRQLLAELGIWDALPAERITGVRAMEVFGDRPAWGNRPARLGLSAWQAGSDYLAWIVESRELERVLRQAVQWSGIRWTTEEFTALGHGPELTGVTLRTSGGQALHARLAVAADGAESRLRAAAGLPANRSDYGATGVVVHLTSELPHQECACQWFTPDGVLALLPMPDTDGGPQVSMVWSMPRAQADTLLGLPEAERVAALEARLALATQGRLGALRVRSPLHGFPLVLQHSPQLTHGGVILVGDAAHVVHPLAGQGLNLGLGDVQALAQVLGGREPFRPVDDPRLLRRYERARAEPLLAMRVVTDGLFHLFGAQPAPVAWLRNAGLDLVDRMPLLKRMLVNGASGA
ncbi:ubiquinone biosynthesis protein UbiH [Pigmentiphaga sp. NML080357]|uniref:FAD-dependent monooxygenase n=1 Tax=Pigmentiphaga sp. NML080357 TaxID=2008675 RepID=UPI000B41CA05|nr:FAD-dependent monooxygenase [Pigmentiphaga sp. NML080357]OVZ56915.1 ubiquinone biosynthesis protein UbiH [Pigmentiphaga sp. NML080357]